SGSVAAQRLFFGFCDAGDLTPFFSGYFDTETGPKRAAASYARIAEAIGLAPTHVLFLSDVVQELDAARAAGMRTTLLARPPAPVCRRLGRLGLGLTLRRLLPLLSLFASAAGAGGALVYLPHRPRRAPSVPAAPAADKTSPSAPDDGKDGGDNDSDDGRPAA